MCYQLQLCQDLSRQDRFCCEQINSTREIVSLSLWPSPWVAGLPQILSRHHHQSFLGHQHPMWPWKASLRWLGPKRLIQGINRAKIALIGSLRHQLPQTCCSKSPQILAFKGILVASLTTSPHVPVNSVRTCPPLAQGPCTQTSIVTWEIALSWWGLSFYLYVQSTQLCIFL